MSKPRKKKMFLNLIVACDKNGGIGLNGGLPWSGHFKHDISNFKELTTGHGVIMGRKTWESLPDKHKPLKGRRNYIVSSTLKTQDVIDYDKTAFVYETVADAISGAKMDGVRQLWVIGGTGIYDYVINNMAKSLNHVWITKIDGEYSHDTKFPLYHFLSPDFSIVHKTKSGIRYEINRYS